MEKQTKKRIRSENWLEEEKILLKSLVQERVSAIENKNTDSNSNAKKLKAWTDLYERFNASSTRGHRTIGQLKSQWSIIKMNDKKKKAMETNTILKTGSGILFPQQPGGDSEIESWLPNEFVIDTNEIDSDQIYQYNISTTKKRKDDDKVVVVAVIREDLGMAMEKEKNMHKLAEPQASVESAKINSIKNEEKPAEPQSSAETATKNRTKNEEKEHYVEMIANTETRCRRELHEAQMRNEAAKAENLKLKKELLLLKIEHYKTLIT